MPDQVSLPLVFFVLIIFVSVIGGCLVGVIVRHIWSVINVIRSRKRRNHNATPQSTEAQHNHVPEYEEIDLSQNVAYKSSKDIIS